MEKDSVFTFAPSTSEETLPNNISTILSFPPKLSKNQQKRLLREAKRKETKAEWRKLQKTKRKFKEMIKKEECAAKGIYFQDEKFV